MTLIAEAFGTELLPSEVYLSRHAVARYAERRSGGDPEGALRRLLQRAAMMPTAPLQLVKGRMGRRYVVGDVALILSGDHSTLITTYRLDPRRGNHRGGRRSRG